MKKKTINAFTLVEMLIVIVIIGILIAALLPRMSAAQWRARDVSRKTALSQIQSAIVTYQGDKWVRPQQDTALGWMWIDYSDTTTGIAKDLINAWMSWIPSDPLKEAQFKWIWSSTLEITWWQFGYVITKRNWSEKAWFVLMAKTEVEWGSNWVVCDNASDIEHGLITSWIDISTQVSLCPTLTQNTTSGSCSASGCVYEKESQLRYIVMY